jgi:acyl-CoA synthetase (AMP-forming)/AMP-acid ligase II
MSRAALEAALHRATGVVANLGAAGDRVATCQDNDLDAFATSWAMMLAGVVEVPVPAAASADEAHHVLADARPTALLLDARAPRVRDAATSLDIPVHVDVPGPATSPDAVHPRTRPMSYTSGTTGRRKGVFAGVHDEAWGRAWLDDERQAFGARHGDRHLVVSPLYHSGPLRHALVCADAGGTVEVLPHFDVSTWIAALRAFRPTSMFCVPTHLHRLLRHPGLRADDLRSLRLLVHAGAPCPVDLKRQVHALAPPGSVWEFYGATEGQFTACPPVVWDAAPGTVGTARPDRTVTVRDHAGALLPPGERGTVWASAPPHARWEYWGLPTATAAAWDGDAFTVGDVGHVDEDGRLFLHGREGDLVITGGVNVYPAEVERALLGIEGVVEVAVVGLPDPDWGERLAAAVVVAPGTDTTPDRVTALARGLLSPARVPKQVVVVDRLPRTPTGKVLRADLARLFEETP